jgi:hypothetical protein
MSSSTKPKFKGQLDISKLSSLLDPTDDETHSIPSVSKLLNRRKILEALKEEKTKSDLLKATIVPTTASKPLSIQKTQRKTVHKPLQSWTSEQLKRAADPMGKGLAHLFQNEFALAALFMSFHKSSEGQFFVASTGVQIENGSPFWDGLKWQPQQFADIWKILVDGGFAEFPPGAQNITRTAFDINPNHWLTLIRVGSPDQCRGLLAVVSKNSLSAKISDELTLFGMNAAPTRKAA